VNRNRQASHWSEPVNLIELRRPAWQNDALCRGNMALFFPEKITVEQAVKAKAICAVCPVARQCLEMAFANDERDGIWGGMTPTERDVQVYGYNRHRSRRPK
jgi:WhiB family redox-sensing transcriptional regulator